MTDIFMGFFLATLIISLFTTRLFRLYSWYALNSLFLGLIAMSVSFELDDNEMLIVGCITIIMKSLIIPFVLRDITLKFNLQRSIPLSIQNHFLVIVVPLILAFTFYLIEPITIMYLQSNYVTIAVSSLFLSLLLIMEHKTVASKVLGFLFIENSLFLLAISATKGMPMIIELGIFVDLMMFIVVINLLFKPQEEK